MRLLVGYFLLVASIALTGVILDQESAPPPVERIVGLASLPERSENVYTSTEQGASPLGVIEVTRQDGVINAVLRRSNSAGELEAAKNLATLEIGYEEPALIVYERSGAWLRIALDGRSGWIQRNNPPESFWPYPALIADKLGFLREDMAAQIHVAPSQGAAMQAVPVEWQRKGLKLLPARLVETQTAGSEVWLHIRVDAAETCGPEDDTLPPFDGWVPAYQSSGDTSVWFYSRGC